MADPSIPSPIGRPGRASFGKYHAVARLGRGGMGDVYLAVNVGPAGISKLVVVKELREELARTPDARTMFLDEARLATRLSHPNVVQTYEVVEEAESLYLTMEFLDGQPLYRIVRGEHRAQFALPMLLHVLTETLAGLHYAHELTDYDGTPLHVVHRDVSPHNVIVTYDGTSKLVDFGIAKAADATTVTESGVFKGKVRFSSPEQALCQEVDRRADVFAVGMVLWEVLTGEPMWRNMPDAAVLLELVSGRIPRPRTVEPNVPEALDAICMKALATDRTRRFATANDFRRALLDWMQATGSVAGQAEIAQALVAAFGEEQRRMRSVVDAEIKALRDAFSTSRRLRRMPELGDVDPSASEATAPERPGKARPASETRTTRRRSRALLLGTAALLLGGTGLALYEVRPRSEATPAPLEASARTLRAAPPSSVQVRLVARPADARFTIDGTAAPSNPFVGSVGRDDGVHHLVATADGYEPRSIDVRFDRDLSIDVALAPAQGPPVRPAAAPGGPRAVSPATPRPRLRPIEEEDPYRR